MVVIVLWECNSCGSRGSSEKGYHIRCEGDGCKTNSFKILDVFVRRTKKCVKSKNSEEVKG